MFVERRRSIESLELSFRRGNSFFICVKGRGVCGKGL